MNVDLRCARPLNTYAFRALTLRGWPCGLARNSRLQAKSAHARSDRRPPNNRRHTRRHACINAAAVLWQVSNGSCCACTQHTQDAAHAPLAQYQVRTKYWSTGRRWTVRTVATWQYIRASGVPQRNRRRLEERALRAYRSLQARACASACSTLPAIGRRGALPEQSCICGQSACVFPSASAVIGGGSSSSSASSSRTPRVGASSCIAWRFRRALGFAMK